MKRILGIYSPPHQHWVGDGFPVRSIFSYHSHGKQVSPFLLLDFAGPMHFSPASHPRGVGQHPHRGFETVTIVYEGEVSHRDSTGQGGTIGPGDVQWMTAASGILHEEFHSDAFTKKGGTLLMAQLWVNLPAKDKMAPPGYQALLANDIPNVSLPNAAGTLRVIAGEYADHKGPAHTFTPMNVWDLHLTDGSITELALPEHWNTILIVLRGSIRVNGSDAVNEAQMVVFDAAGSSIQLEPEGEVKALLLSGEPIDESVIGYGPFVMNSVEQIEQAITDFNSGRFGKITR